MAERRAGWLLVAALGLGACHALERPEPVPAAAGFDRLHSDEQAIEIADDVVRSMGGYDAWVQTRSIAWDFFGMRRHVWDKQEGVDRVEGELPDGGGAYVTVVDLDSKGGSGEGRAWIEGAPVTDERQRAEMLKAAREAWINDSYWLVMPFKLKDTGVTLTYRDPAELDDGRPAEVLRLTFTGVGVTPQNKYLIYVARDTKRVEKWEYFPTADAAEPKISTPWADYRRYGRIWLSGDRGKYRITDIAVYDLLPAETFTDPRPGAMKRLERLP